MGLVSVFLNLFIFFASAEKPVMLDTRKYVDVMIVLAVDVSGSIAEPDEKTGIYEYSLQKKGIVSAFRDENLARVLEQCNTNGVGVAFVEWAGSEKNAQVATVIDWTVLKSRQDLEDFANQVDAHKTRAVQGATDIYSALFYSSLLFYTAPFQSDKKIIQLSSDGTNNTTQRHTIMGVVPPPAQQPQQVSDLRDEIAMQEITINALVIDEIAQLEKGYEPLKFYFENNVQVGPDSYTRSIRHFADYGKVLTENLARDLNNCMF